MSKTSSLWKRLNRELRRHPYKACLLGGLLAVAIWMWIPLVAGRSKAPSTAVPSVDGTNIAAANPPSTGSDAGLPPTNKGKTLGWKRAVEAMQADANMRPAIPAAGARDPFRRNPSAAELARETALAKAAHIMSPRQVGMQLGSTAVGPRSRTALIDGVAYREGQIVRAPNGGARFKLVEIHPEYVVLEQDAVQYNLWLPRSEPVGLEEE